MYFYRMRDIENHIKQNPSWVMTAHNTRKRVTFRTFDIPMTPVILVIIIRKDWSWAWRLETDALMRGRTMGREELREEVISIVGRFFDNRRAFYCFGCSEGRMRDR